MGNDYDLDASQQLVLDVSERQFATVCFLLLSWTRGEEWHASVFSKGGLPHAVVGTDDAQIVFRQTE